MPPFIRIRFWCFKSTHQKPLRSARELSYSAGQQGRFYNIYTVLIPQRISGRVHLMDEVNVWKKWREETVQSIQIYGINTPWKMERGSEEGIKSGSGYHPESFLIFSNFLAFPRLQSLLLSWCPLHASASHCASQVAQPGATLSWSPSHQTSHSV